MFECCEGFYRAVTNSCVPCQAEVEAQDPFPAPLPPHSALNPGCSEAEAAWPLPAGLPINLAGQHSN